MNENHVDVVNAELLPETVEIGANTGGIASIRLGKDCDLIARELLEGCGNIGVATSRSPLSQKNADHSRGSR